ncbi:hypothetical protein NTGBS_80014 [Candidatus Nitrotoga sp. BS]|nr:hypothetical protein NTGBS_80014 [Candidatus Nitrotoga sp. BS]
MQCCTGSIYFYPYNIHHLDIGFLHITCAGSPLVLFNGNSRKRELAAITLGAGRSMALDEWVYLIATDGCDAPHLLPSFQPGCTKKARQLALRLIYENGNLKICQAK